LIINIQRLDSCFGVNFLLKLANREHRLAEKILILSPQSFNKPKKVFMEDNNTQVPKEESLLDKAEKKVDELTQEASAQWEKLEDKAEDLWENREEIAEDLKEKAKEAIDDLKEGAKGLWEKLKDAVDGDNEKKAEA
jgi:DNA repair ATPase RecN